jgi:hypothetical protein
MIEPTAMAREKLVRHLLTAGTSRAFTTGLELDRSAAPIAVMILAMTLQSHTLRLQTWLRIRTRVRPKTRLRLLLNVVERGRRRRVRVDTEFNLPVEDLGRG